MPRTPASAVEAEELEEEPDNRAARKAERQAAKAAAAAAEEAEAKAARKTAKKAAREAAEAEAAEAEVEAEAKAARKAKRKAAAAEAEAQAKAEAKAARKAAKQKEAAAAEETVPEEICPKREKRKAAEAEEGPPQKKERTAVGTSATAFREANQIIVDDGCPEPVQTFDAASLGTVLVKALEQQSYTAPTPIQAQAWPIALQGRDMIAVAKTGSGKTCGFLLPALARIKERGPSQAPKKINYWLTEPAQPTVLVLAPTRELAQQIAGEAEKFAPAVRARVVSVYGGVPKGDQVRELRKGCDVLIATPGRLLDLAAGDSARNLKPTVALPSVTYLVLDEADRMLDMGFEPDIRKIVEQCPKTGKPEEGGGASGLLAGSMRQTLFFTATWPKSVEQTAADFTSKDAVQIRIGQGTDGDTLTANANVTQTVHVLDETEKLSKLKEILNSDLHKGETAIVFVGQKHRCDDVTGDLQRSGLGFWCKTIHSGKDQWTRDEALAQFREITAGGSSTGSKWQRGVLVATDVAARGLDIPGVALVIVYDFGRALSSGQNGGVESYVHRIGRTGRAGLRGRAVTFFTSEDQGSKELSELLRGANQTVPESLEAMIEGEEHERWVRDRKQAYWSNRKGGKGGSKGKGGKGSAKGAGRSGGAKGGGGRGYSKS